MAIDQSLMGKGADFESPLEGAPEMEVFKISEPLSPWEVDNAPDDSPDVNRNLHGVHYLHSNLA